MIWQVGIDSERIRPAEPRMIYEKVVSDEEIGYNELQRLCSRKT